MNGKHLSQARFVTTAVSAPGYPQLKNAHGHFLPEIAVAGRSNVGKSSLLNTLFQRKGMVKTSSRPGKTQTLNFFVTNETISFVDLPGYGYAEVPSSVRRKWGSMVQEYFDSRETLQLLLFLFDIRRTPNDDDRQLLQWIHYHQIPMVCVLTKVDKLSPSQRKQQERKILEGLGNPPLRPLLFSIPQKMGRQELLREILSHLNREKGGE